LVWLSGYQKNVRELRQNRHMSFRFIDLFAGIGGFRLALEANGGECVFSSEWDKKSQAVYKTNHGDLPAGDITQIDERTIPAFDVLAAGFPCQAFSVSGKRLGFEDSRGTLFYDIARIAKFHKPKILFLENVKNIVRHDNGNTMRVISAILDEIGYDLYLKVIRSSDFGLPQARERAYFVCVNREFSTVPFSFPEFQGPIRIISDVLEKQVDENLFIDREDIEIYKNEFDVVDRRRPLQIGKLGKGGQGERIYSIHASGITLSAYGGGAAAKTGAYFVDGRVRKLSPRECARLQGFPESFKPDSSRNYAYKQFGDSVSVPVLTSIFKAVTETYNLLT
jgi:DNA (cytosine-5)-methyltransferase 1